MNCKILLDANYARARLIKGDSTSGGTRTQKGT